MTKNIYDVRANILKGLNEGKPLTRIFDPKGRSYPPSYRQHVNHLISMGYVVEDTLKLTETGLLFLQAYEQPKRLLRGEDVEEWIVLDKEVKKFSLDLLEKIKRKVNDDIYTIILMEAKEPKKIAYLISKTGINYRSIKKHLSTLIDAKLIKYIGTNRDTDKRKRGKYETTDRGSEFVEWHLYLMLFARASEANEKWEILEKFIYTKN